MQVAVYSRDEPCGCQTQSARACRPLMLLGSGWFSVVGVALLQCSRLCCGVSWPGIPSSLISLWYCTWTFILSGTWSFQLGFLFTRGFSYVNRLEQAFLPSLVLKDCGSAPWLWWAWRQPGGAENAGDTALRLLIPLRTMRLFFALRLLIPLRTMRLILRLPVGHALD